MLICKWQYGLQALILCIATTATMEAFAQAQNHSEEAIGEREEFQRAYNQQKRRASFFASAPSHHVTPKRDNISFTIDTKAIDVGIAPSVGDTPDSFTDLDHRLEMTGWSVFPLVAFSAENFGLGFTGEAGTRQIKFLSRQADTEALPGSFFEQYSDMKYTGAGIYGFALLRSKALPSWFAGTLIAGGRSLTAVHETRGTRTDSTVVPEATKLKYDANIFDAGFNVAATLAKRFTVFPWVNYRKVQLTSLKDHNESSASEILTPDLEQAVNLDRSLTWQADPAFTYGLDFAVQIQKFQLHLGGVFGYLASMNRGADRVQDKTINLGVSYDFKSR